MLTPNINPIIILGAGKDQLRRSVVPADHIRSILELLIIDDFRGAEVTDPHLSILD